MAFLRLYSDNNIAKNKTIKTKLVVSVIYLVTLLVFTFDPIYNYDQMNN